MLYSKVVSKQRASIQLAQTYQTFHGKDNGVNFATLSQHLLLISASKSRCNIADV